MKLDMSKLGSKELKALANAVKVESKRRHRKSPDNHEPPVWTIPNDAVVGGHQEPAQVS